MLSIRVDINEVPHELTAGQAECLDYVLENINDVPAFSIRGNAGVGKSTLFVEMAKELRARGHHVKTCALTHKAAMLLNKKVRATSTVHSLFGLRPEIDYKTGVESYKPLGKAKTEYGDIVLVDESSMLSRELFDILTAAYHTQGIKYVFFGDPYQLPPVNEELSSALVLPHTKNLTEVVRHDSEILELSTACCEAVRTGKNISVSRFRNDTNIRFLKKDEFIETMIEKMKEAFPIEGAQQTDKVKYVAWTNNAVDRTAQMIRKEIGRSYIPESGEVVTVSAAYVKHDVMLYQNNEEVTLSLVREDTVTVHDHELHGVYCTTTKFPQQKHFIPTDRNAVVALMKDVAAKCSENKHWGEYYKLKRQFLPIAYPQASTVHKSQGSTYEGVFVDLPDIRSCTDPTVYARLLYVAVSRASDCVYIRS